MRSLSVHIQELRRALFTELRAALGDIIDQDNGVETPLSIAHAAEFRSIEKLIEDAANQITPIAADSNEINPLGTLEYYGMLKGITRTPAQPGIYIAEIEAISGTDGGNIPQRTEFTSTTKNTGINLYSIEQANLTPSNSTAQIKVQSLETGANSNLEKGTIITFNTSIPNIEEQAQIIDIIQNPTDIENIEDFRNRVINAFRYEVSGGNTADFRLWALQIQGVKNAFPYNTLPNSYFANNVNTANLGLGFPRIYLELFNNSESEQIIKNYIDALSQKAPMNAGQVIVQPCRVLNFTITISEIQGSNDRDMVFQSVWDSIESYFETRRPFIPAIDKFDNSQINRGEILLKINSEANGQFIISSFQPEQFSDTCTLQIGEIPKLSQINGINYSRS